MINLKSSSTVLSRFSFSFISFSWSSSATRIRIPVFALVRRKQLLPRLLHPVQSTKIDEVQVGNAGRFFVKYYKNDSPLFLGSPFLLSPFSSWKFNLRTISPLYRMDYKFLINNEEKIGISEVVIHATAQQKMSIAFNELLRLQTIKIYEEAVTARKLWTKGRSGFLVSPYSPVIFSLSSGSQYSGASRGRISLDVHSHMALSQLYEMAYKCMDNDATKVRFSELWEVAVEEGNMYCEWDIYKSIKDMLFEIEEEFDNQIEDDEPDPDGNVDADTEDDQEVNNEEGVDSGNHQGADIDAVETEDDEEDPATSAHQPPTED